MIALKIVLIVSLFPPKWLGGIEVATYFIAKHLTQKGHNVHVITFLDKGMPDVSNEFGFNVHRLFYRRIGILGRIQFWYKSFFKLNIIKPDVVHIQAIENGIPGFLTKLLFKTPYVIYGHGSDVYLPWAFKKPISKIVLSYADAVVALTDNMKDKMQKMYMRSVSVIPNGIEVAKFKINGDKEKSFMNEKTIIFVGRLQCIKGVKYLIQAMCIIRQNYNVKLIIIGDGEEKEELKELANNLNLRDCVKFAGRIDNEKVPEYMARADIFVLPSLSEGFPIVILEAMASKLPIVATNVRGLPDIVEDGVNGFLVEPGNPEQIAEKIILLLNDDELRLKISKANREKAKKYDWSCVVEKLEGVYYSAFNSL